LQGTFEKIGFQRFVRHQPLQLRGLQSQFPFSGVLRRTLSVVDRLQLITPLVRPAALPIT
jgi:hypothetical protein